MGDKRRLGFQSALLVSWGVIGLTFVGAVFMWWFGLPRIGVLLMAVSVTGFVSRMWGMYALRGLEAEVTPERECLSVGQSVTVHYVLSNRKALPLIWVELLQDVPAGECLVPESGFERVPFSVEEAEHSGKTEAYLRRMSFLPGYGCLAWDTVWNGMHRGVYSPRDLVLRSGDGFGLTQSAGEVRGLHGQVVVWPKLVPVRTEPFLRHVWTGNTGRLGWTEDPTVLRDERAYIPGDPWKRIDWRNAARTDELTVRQFETIRPLSALFLLDAASFADAEEAISLLASVIRALYHEGIRCGLALPASGKRPGVLLHPDHPETEVVSCLYALSDFDAEHAGGRFDVSSVLAAAVDAGQVWIVTRSAEGIRCPELAERMTETGAGLICEERGSGLPAARKCFFDELRRTEG